MGQMWKSMKSMTRPCNPDPRTTRSVRLPSAPPRISPSATAVSMFRCRNAVATMSTETMIVAPANNHGALPPMLNAPPEFVVNRSVSTPGIRSAGASCRVRSAQSFVRRSSR